jgi:hypothetical protein
MTIAFSSKSLGAGSIQDNGFWVTRDSWILRTSVDGWGPYGYQHNTNDISKRADEDAAEFNEQLPFIEFGERVWFIKDDMPYPALFEMELPRGGDENDNIYRPVKTIDGHMLYGRKSDFSTDIMPAKSGQTEARRHAHRFLIDDPSGAIIEDGYRIQINESGCTDTLPGLFELKVVPGTVVEGGQCSVLILEKNNAVTFWRDGHAAVETHTLFSYGNIRHPYLQEESAQAVVVDLSTDNWNKHVIPGIALQFASKPSETGRCTIAIGYEYVNAWSDGEALGEAGGRDDYFSPICNYGAVGLHTNSAYEGKQTFLRWNIANVTGELQEGCRFHVRPLIRLQQTNALIPFVKWFMGYSGENQLSESLNAYEISFSGLHQNTITLLFDGSVAMMIREIDADTFLPTGVEHSNAEDLRCDGETLYRWDSLGVYFVLSAQVTNTSTASVWCRPGCEIEKRLRLDIDQFAGNSTYYLEDPPFSNVIGGWDGVVVSETESYPISPYMQEDRFTGKIQAQGYSYQFFNGSIDTTRNTWLNHEFEVCTYPSRETPTIVEEGQHGEYCIMVTCDNPKYFQVIPMMFFNGATPTKPLIGTTPTVSMHGQVIVQDDPVTMTGTLQVLNTDRSMTLRINQISEELAEILEANGIEML